ncbi:uncharacterized protein LOC111114020 [Crassostrea virginica]
MDIFCKECQIPLCSKCSTSKEHYRHTFGDLEEIYAEKYKCQQSEFAKIQRYFLPTTQSLKKDIKRDVTEIKNIMESIRTSMKGEAESLKNLLDEVTLENMEHTYTIEKSLLKVLESQETTYDDYIAYLERMTDEFQKHLSFTNKKLLFSKTLKIETIPETTKPALPVFIKSQFNKKYVTTLLGRVYVQESKQRRRNFKPIEEIFTPLKSTEKHLNQSKEKSDIIQTLSLSNSVTKVREYSVPGVHCALHVSVDKSGKLWVSDGSGNLVQTDQEGNLLQKIQTSDKDEGNHTATQDGDLIYTDRDKKSIYIITPDKKVTEIIKTKDWRPGSVHSSRINGDILVGMDTDEEAKVTRYSKAGKEIQNIQWNNEGQELYSEPDYITENINGDICTSDYGKDSLVVVNKSGQHRFSYTGQGSVFRPWGICTDVLGHILVGERSVHLLDQDGRFLTFIVSSQQEFEHLVCVCVDDENNLYVGQLANSSVSVYKYLK